MLSHWTCQAQVGISEAICVHARPQCKSTMQCSEQSVVEGWRLTSKINNFKPSACLHCTACQSMSKTSSVCRPLYAVKRDMLFVKIWSALFLVKCFVVKTSRFFFFDLTWKSSTLQLHVCLLTWRQQTMLKWLGLILAAFWLCSWIIMVGLLFGTESLVAKSQCYLSENKHCPPVPWNLGIFF